MAQMRNYPTGHYGELVMVAEDVILENVLHRVTLSPHVSGRRDVLGQVASFTT